MTFQDTYEMLVMIGEFNTSTIVSTKYPSLAASSAIALERKRMVEELTGLHVQAMSFGRNRHTTLFDLDGWTLYVYVNGSLVLYRGDYEEGMKPERTFDSFEEVKEYITNSRKDK